MKLKDILPGVIPAIFAGNVALAAGEEPKHAQAVPANSVEITLGGETTTINEGITTVQDCMDKVVEYAQTNQRFFMKFNLGQGSVVCKEGESTAATIKAGGKAGGGLSLHAITPDGKELLKKSSLKTSSAETSADAQPEISG